MKELQPMKTEKRQNMMKRREFLKVPLLTTGILFGALYLPPLSKVAFSAVQNIELNLRGYVWVGFKGMSFTLPIPSFLVKKMVLSGVNKTRKKANQFSPLKRRIQHWVVKQLPKTRTPVLLSDIAEQFGQSIKTIESIVNELEKDMTFLFRNQSKGINWAYPVTVEPTPHHVTFSSGEAVYAA